MKDSEPALSVLVVDDDPDTAESTAHLLYLCGYTARFALCGEDALRSAAADPPDVVLLDLRMPDMDGFEVARRLAALRAVKPPLVVALTGCEGAAERAGAASAGFHMHLVKPVEPAFLIGLMRRIRRAVAPVPPADRRAPESDPAANRPGSFGSPRLATSD